MDEMQKRMWSVLVGKDAETAVGLILDYHGAQLLDEGFAEFLVDEDACERKDLFDEDED